MLVSALYSSGMVSLSLFLFGEMLIRGFSAESYGGYRIDFVIVLAM